MNVRNLCRKNAKHCWHWCYATKTINIVWIVMQKVNLFTIRYVRRATKNNATCEWEKQIAQTSRKYELHRVWVWQQCEWTNTWYAIDDTRSRWIDVSRLSGGVCSFDPDSDRSAKLKSTRLPFSARWSKEWIIQKRKKNQIDNSCAAIEPPNVNFWLSYKLKLPI